MTIAMRVIALIGPVLGTVPDRSGAGRARDGDFHK